MRRLRVVLCAVFVMALGGCGDDAPQASGPTALKYVPAVARTDFSTWDSDPLGLETVPLGKAVGELEASREGVDARLRIEVPGGLSR